MIPVYGKGGEQVGAVCRQCRERVDPQASKCPHCGSSLSSGAKVGRAIAIVVTCILTVLVVALLFGVIR